ncbi:MAG: phosphoribosylamine--glycine ligase [candidate division Zixibacteria bacterium]|nr:phosphoribosylamine--glycine ligase [Candidatus Tariuqbacter arcticus]
MNLLIIGSGGREHALCWKIAQSPLCDKLYCIPGNGGISAQWECPKLDGSSFEALAEFARAKNIDFTIVGPEQPLVDGIVNYFDKTGLKICGPTASAALIEGDKAFAKELMSSSGVPTARFTIHHNLVYTLESPHLKKFPAVIKVSGLAAGKGVFIVDSPREAENILTEIFARKKFGDAGSTVVVEECLTGDELSIFAITDGEDFIILPPSQDHKRIGEGDTGLNTGGMGACAPAPIGDPDTLGQIEERIIIPTLEAMRRRGTPYRGLLYCGLMITEKGPRVLEFNCRFGDPESQCVLPLIKPDLLELLLASAEEGGIARWKRKNPWEVIYTGNEYAACVVLASEGYPGSYQKGILIAGHDREYQDTIIFHAGTKYEGERFITSGGRVLGVTGLGKSLKEALDRAYSAIESINFQGKYYRRDIGWRALYSNI